MRFSLVLVVLVGSGLVKIGHGVGSGTNLNACVSLRSGSRSGRNGQTEQSICKKSGSQLPEAADQFSQIDTKLWLIKHSDEHHTSNRTDSRLILHHQSIDSRRSDLSLLTDKRKLVNFHHYKFDSGYPDRDSLNLNLVSGPRVHDVSCRRHLEQMLQLLEELQTRVGQLRNGVQSANNQKLDERHFRLARVLDAFGRYESGQLEGRHHSFGVYEQCVKTSVILGDDHQKVESRYCWAHLKLDGHLSETLKGIASPHGAQQIDFAYHIAICLPATCHSKSFISDEGSLQMAQRLVEYQNLLPESSYIESGLPLESIFCLVDEDSEIAAMTIDKKLFIMLAVVWLLACLYATFKVWTRDEQTGRNCVLSQLDLKGSWRDLARRANQSSSLVRLDSLSCMQIVSGFFIFLVHSRIIASSMIASPRNYEPDYMMSQLVVPSFLMFDSFLVVTWMKTAYIILSEPSEIDGDYGRGFYLTWFRISTKLYLGLAPLYLLVFLFKKTVYVKLGSGPLWDFGLNKATSMGGCKNAAWLDPLTASGTLEPIFSQCLPQSWLISNQLLLTLTMPPIIVLLRRRFRLACVSMVLISLVNIVLSYRTFSNSMPRVKMGLELLDPEAILEVLKTESFIYTTPFFRIPVGLVGVFSGYVLSELEIRARNQAGPCHSDESSSETYWPSWFRKFATQQALIYIAITLIMMTFMTKISEGASQSIKGVLMKNFVLSGHLNWAISNAILFMRISTDWKDNYVVQLARRWPTQMARRLIPVSTLIHWDILTYLLLTATQPFGWTLPRIVSAAWLTMIPFSVLIHVLFERPLAKLMKFITTTRY